jgi:putative transcriptional regulator
VVVAAGVEAVVACRRADVEITTHLAAGPVAAEAASRGLDAAAVVAADSVGRVTDALRDRDALYELVHAAGGDGDGGTAGVADGGSSTPRE